MISQIQQTIVEKLLALCDLSADIRFGQLMANLGFLSEEFENQSLWDIEDEPLLNVIEIHLAQLRQRQKAIAEQAVQPDTDKAAASRPAMPILKS
ncbi:MAG: hypothetical protein WCH39_19575 [Schlesneria sp.]